MTLAILLLLVVNTLLMVLAIAGIGVLGNELRGVVGFLITVMNTAKEVSNEQDTSTDQADG